MKVKMNIKKITFILIIAALWLVSAIAVGRYLVQKLPQQTFENKSVTQTQKIVDEESVVIDAVKKVSPSVVSIAVENQQSSNPFFNFGQSSQQQSGIGTAFIVSKDGLILTNKHVVSQSGASYVAILRGSDGNERKLPIKKINLDPFNDLALVQVDATDLQPVELGDSDHLQVGQLVVAIGNALGRFDNTVTTGVVSALGRAVSPIDPSTGVAERLDDLIQTDAAVNPGNSGGPLLNSAGQVIGVNTAVASAQNIAFAIKINVAKTLIADFQSSGGKISRPFLGIRYTHIPKDSAMLNNVPEGELVGEVVSGSAAQAAGVKVGDIITDFDGQRLTGDTTLNQVIRSKKVGDKVAIRVFRDGKTLDLSATLGEAPTQ